MFAAVAQNQHTHRRGFTLIELLVVMSVIAILAALLVPALALVQGQMRTAAARKMIGGIKMAMTMYKNRYKCYPPDKRAGLSMSSQCLVLYLSGPTLFYDATASPINYPWTHNLYDVAPGKGGEGRRELQRYYDFKAKYLKNFGDNAPALVDPWGNRFIYNATGDPNDTSGNYDRYGDAKHGGREYDLFSAGPDGVYGTPDDITSWEDKLRWGYSAAVQGAGFDLNDDTH